MQKFKDYINHLNDQTNESSFNTKMWYVNNLDKVPFPDPQVFYEEGVYYIVGTTDYNISVIDCYTTTDFVNFERHEKLYDPSLYNGWESDNPLIFAAELYKLDGRYYLYYDTTQYTLSVYEKGTGKWKTYFCRKVHYFEQQRAYGDGFTCQRKESFDWGSNDNMAYASVSEAS